MTKILVVNGPNYGEALAGLGDISYDPSILLTDKYKDVKLILFTGGEDITPSYYKHTSPRNMCYYSERRDAMESKILDAAKALNIRCIGICRGIQFLNVMAGGQMFHDVNNHAGCQHEMETVLGEQFKVNSLHHQMLIPAPDAHLIAWSKESRSTRYFGDKDVIVDPPEKEPEALLLPSLKSAGVQYHPEMMSNKTEGYQWFWQLAKDLINIEDFNDIIEKYTGVSCINQYMQQQL